MKLTVSFWNSLPVGANIDMFLIEILMGLPVIAGPGLDDPGGPF